MTFHKEGHTELSGSVWPSFEPLEKLNQGLKLSTTL